MVACFFFWMLSWAILIGWVVIVVGRSIMMELAQEWVSW